MERFVINGGRKLSGKITVESAKNAVLPILAGAMLTDEQVIIENCPKISDVLTMIEILKLLGASIHFEGKNLIINPYINSYIVDEELSCKMRSSVYMMGTLVSRTGKAFISYPGGCNIGLRPIGIHVDALKKLGVDITEYCGSIFCSAEKITGSDIFLDFPSVGATENIMLCSALCTGHTVIYNPAKEPEIVDLQNFINSMGGKIYGAGTNTIYIEGVKKLHGTTYKPIGDRIEAGTYLLASAITGGNIEINNVNAKNISSLIHKLSNNTCKIDVKNDIICMRSMGSRKGFSFSTGPYPFFATDMQAQTVSLLAVSDGISIVTENVFETRFNHISELIKMGADIKIKDKSLIIKGVRSLDGANVTAKDLRGGAALVLAGLSANGKTVVNDVYHIDRGYLDFENKLSSLGGDIERKK